LLTMRIILPLLTFIKNSKTIIFFIIKIEVKSHE